LFILYIYYNHIILGYSSLNPVKYICFLIPNTYIDAMPCGKKKKRQKMRNHKL